MKKKKISLINICFFLIAVFIVLNFLNINIQIKYVDFAVIATFLINAVICIINIIRDHTPYSLNKTFWYYNLIFNFVAPIIQYLSSYNEWGYKLDNTSYLISNILILITLLIFMIGYKKIAKNQILEKTNDKNNLSKNENIWFVITIICLLISVKNVGIANLFSRTENVYSLSSDSMFNTVFTHLLKCIPVFSFMISYKKNSKITIKGILVLAIIFILNFPTSTTRFWMGAIYIGLFVVLLCKKISNNRLYDILILLIFTIVFPLLYNFKFHDLNYFIENGIEIKEITESYNSVDYDAYSIIGRGLDYVEDNDFSYGKQFVGTLFFWIPRSIWNEKPYPTGELIASAQNQRYTNISCPFLVEGYLNFGIIGIIIFHIFLVSLCQKIDREYWTNQNEKITLNILYPFLLGFLIYLERGALHPVIVYLFCFVLPFIFTKILNFVFKKKGTKYVKSINSYSHI